MVDGRFGAWLVVAALLFGVPAATTSDPQGDECAAYRVEVPVESVVASAAILPNLLYSDKSVRSESARLLTEAGEEITRAEAPPDICPAGCVTVERPEVIFRSSPVAVLDDYEESDRCETLLEESSKQPLQFEQRRFDTARELTEWVESFTRGKGSDGKALYERCNGRCSPRYEWTIARNGEHFVVDTRVVCGHARDRGSNEYDLSYGLLWNCTSP